VTTTDLLIVVASLLGLILLAGWLAARQSDTTDYYLGGRHLPAWALGLSLAANQVSAISLVGAPAFVALREGGGLIWLQYELAVPLAMAGLILWGVPVLRRAPSANVYEAVESRLGVGARRTLAAFFLLGRGLGAGVILYTSSLVVDAATGWGLLPSLAVVGAVSIGYTTLGGLTADVFSDVLQLGLLWGGTLVAMVFLALRLGGEGGVLAGVDPSRLVPLDLAGHGLGDGSTFAFWPMLCGGLFLYVSYYGCDQTQAQRILAAPTPHRARSALLVAGLVRFPLVLTYCLFGVLLASLLTRDPSFASSLVQQPPDALVPQFMVHFLPVGVLGVAVAGILAAALSSIDSALNSLSAVTVEEFFPEIVQSGSRSALLLARGGTLAWGAWATATGWWFSRAGETVIELVNQVGSLVYGPILALFLMAWGSRHADGRSAVVGALTGVSVNLALARFVPSVSWLWWNVAGCVTAVLVGEVGGRLRGAEPVRPERGRSMEGSGSEQARAGERGGAPAPSRGDPQTALSPETMAKVLVLEFVLMVAGLGVLSLLFGPP
jgi:SSS family solute:Na+ symporter